MDQVNPDLQPVDTHLRVFMRVSETYLKLHSHDTDADDAVQRAAERLLMKYGRSWWDAPSSPPNGKGRGFFFQCIRNAATSEYRLAATDRKRLRQFDLDTRPRTNERYPVLGFAPEDVPGFEAWIESTFGHQQHEGTRKSDWELWETFRDEYVLGGKTLRDIELACPEAKRSTFSDWIHKRLPVLRERFLLDRNAKPSAAQSQKGAGHGD